jgi:hypothetical protein
MMRLKNKKGFAMILILALLPVLVGGMLAVLFVINFIQLNAHHQYLCRSNHLKTQGQVIPLLESLLKLNPLSRKLRIELLAAEAHLAAVTASAPLLIPAAEARLLKVQMQRAALDQQQKQLINMSNRWLYIGHAQTQMQLRSEIQKDLRLLKPFIQSSFTMDNSSAPKLAVHPDFPDTAPTYSPDENIADTQALAHRWHYNLEIAGFLQSFLQGKQQYNKECAVTVAQQGSKWVAQIHKVKSWSKLSW